MFKSKFRVGDEVLHALYGTGFVIGFNRTGGQAVIQFRGGDRLYNSFHDDSNLVPIIPTKTVTQQVWTVDGVDFVSEKDAGEYFYAQREESRSIDDLSLEELQEWYNEYNEYVRAMTAQSWGVFRVAYDTTFAESALSASDVAGEFLNAISRKRNAGNEA